MGRRDDDDRDELERSGTKRNTPLIVALVVAAGLLLVGGGGAVLAVGYWLRAAAQEQAAVVQAQQAEAAQVQAAAEKVDLKQPRTKEQWTALVIGKTPPQLTALLGPPKTVLDFNQISQTKIDPPIWYYHVMLESEDGGMRKTVQINMPIKFSSGVAIKVW